MSEVTPESGSSIELAEGYYILGEDVKNPHADRRSKSFDKLPVWKKGTKFRLKKTVHGDYRFTLFHGSCDYNYDQVYGVLRPYLVPAPLNLAQITEKYFSDPQDILAQMLKMGMVTIEQVQEAAHVLYDVDAESEDQFLEKLREDQWLNEPL